MFTKKLFQKATQQLLQQRDRDRRHNQHPEDLRQELPEEDSQPPADPLGDAPLTAMDFRPRFTVHYGIPITARILALDPIQSLVAVGTLDGRIKVIGGNNIEALLVSPKQMSMKHLEFLKNQGFLASVSNDNDIQVWDLKDRCIACSLEWESNITAFSVIQGTKNMYIGDENGMVYALKFDADERKLIQLPYLIPADSISEAAQIPVPHHQSVVGVLTQPCSKGNRMLIAYEQGLLVLWDLSRNQVSLVRGCKDLQLKSRTVMNIPSSGNNVSSRESSDDEQLDKEISSLCWASSDGSVLAVGYIDGDMMFWNMETSVDTRSHQSNISDNVVKLQLSSANRRLPVIVLHWSTSRMQNGYGGRLFVYGGDEIGSEEVLTILNLQWSHGLNNVKCLGRTDLTLTDSFADMALLPTVNQAENTRTESLVVLTNPGQLHLYDDDALCTLLSHGEQKATVAPSTYTAVVPNAKPLITVAKLAVVDPDGKFSSTLSKIVAEANRPTASSSGNSSKWPLTGGVPSQNYLNEAFQVEKLYIACYHDGSVRVWDASTPAFSPICVLLPEVEGITLARRTASISAIDICSITLSLAVGDESGLIRLYQMTGSNDTMLHIITDKVNEVKSTVQQDGPRCVALVSLLESPICNVQFANGGSRLAIGYACGQVAVLDTGVPSVLSVTDCSSEASSPIISLAVITTSDEIMWVQRGASESDRVGNPPKCITLVLAKNSCITVLDNADGGVIGSQLFNSEESSSVISFHIIDDINETTSSGHSNTLVVLCCEDSISLFPLTCAIQMDQNLVQTVNLAKPCCWTSTLKREGADVGIVLFYRTGDIELRSLPNLQVVGESSLMSILRWNFKAYMEKTISSSENGQITLVNGCEFAVLSLLDKENDLRIPLSLPSLHDEVLEAASSSCIDLSADQKKQNVSRGIFGGVFKGLIPGEEDDDIHGFEEDIIDPAHIGAIFSEPLMFESTSSFAPGGVIELNIDDIEIDEPVALTPFSTSSQQTKPKPVERDDRGDREKLFGGTTADAQPRMRTREEIIAKYRKTEAKDASAAASQARDKLMERGEKLERLNLRTQELQDGAENFASLASELAKTMESRNKWWNMF